MSTVMNRRRELPKDQSFATLDWFSITSPMSMKLPLPRSLLMAKVVTEGMNTMVTPLMMPGTERGSVTFRNTRAGLAPRSWAASITRWSIFLRLV